MKSGHAAYDNKIKSLLMTHLFQVKLYLVPYALCLGFIHQSIDMHYKNWLFNFRLNTPSRPDTTGTLPGSPFVDGRSHHG